MNKSIILIFCLIVGIFNDDIPLLSFDTMTDLELTTNGFFYFTTDNFISIDGNLYLYFYSKNYNFKRAVYCVTNSIPTEDIIRNSQFYYFNNHKSIIINNSAHYHYYLSLNAFEGNKYIIINYTSSNSSGELKAKYSNRDIENIADSLTIAGIIGIVIGTIIGLAIIISIIYCCICRRRKVLGTVGYQVQPQNYPLV